MRPGLSRFSTTSGIGGALISRIVQIYLCFLSVCLLSCSICFPNCLYSEKKLYCTLSAAAVVVAIEVIPLCLLLIPLFFHFRRRFDVHYPPPNPLPLQVWPSALFVGVCTGKLAAGPRLVRGDGAPWGCHNNLDQMEESDAAMRDEAAKNSNIWERRRLTDWSLNYTNIS